MSAVCRDARLTKLKIDEHAVGKFLSKVFEYSSGGQISLLGIGEKGTPQEGVYRKRIFIPQDQGAAIFAHVARWAEMGVAAFFVPATIKDSAVLFGDVALDKISGFTSIVLDLDSGDVDRKVAYVSSALGSPSMVVASGGKTDEGQAKRHLWYMLNEETDAVERVAFLRKLLAMKCGGDQSFGRATQVIRIAGSVHAKQGVQSPVELLECNDREYSLEDLAETIEAMQPMPGLPEPVQSQLPALVMGGMMDFSPRTDTAAVALSRDINEGGQDLTRFSEFSKVAGLKINEVRAGRISIETAYNDVNGWVLVHMNPPWPAARIDQEFRALCGKDLKTHGLRPTAIVDSAGLAGLATSVRANENGEAITLEWADPKPLPKGLPPVATFDAGMLPPALRDWTMDIAERMNAPAEFIGVTAMVAAGSLAGRKVGVRPQEHTDWTEVPNLWGCIIGRPGVMKSPSMKQALAPLYQLEAAARDDHSGRLAEFEALEIQRELKAKFQKIAMEKRLRENPNADLSDLLTGANQAPLGTRYIVNDGGYQALSEVLRNCAPNGVLAYRDELMSLLKFLDDECRVEDRGFYLTGWNGMDSYTSDRIGRGYNLHIPAVTISLLGSTQPGKITDYIADAISGGAGDDGLVQRFSMLVWPDLSPSWREVDRVPSRTARDGAYKAFDQLAALAPADVDAQRDEYNPELAYLRFDPDAQVEFKRWWSKLEHRLRSDELHPALESHLSKYRKLVPTLALLHHILCGRRGAINAESLLAACAWGEYLESHAQRLYGAATDRTVTNATSILRRIRKGDLEPTFSLRDLHQKGWTGLTEAPAVRAAAERLEANHFLRIEAKQNPRGGRPTEVCTVNPKILH